MLPRRLLACLSWFRPLGNLQTYTCAAPHASSPLYFTLINSKLFQPDPRQSDNQRNERKQQHGKNAICKRDESGQQVNNGRPLHIRTKYTRKVKSLPSTYSNTMVASLCVSNTLSNLLRGKNSVTLGTISGVLYAIFGGNTALLLPPTFIPVKASLTPGTTSSAPIRKIHGGALGSSYVL